MVVKVEGDLASGLHSTCLSGTLTELCGLLFCVKVRGMFICCEKTWRAWREACWKRGK